MTDMPLENARHGCVRNATLHRIVTGFKFFV